MVTAQANTVLDLLNRGPRSDNAIGAPGRNWQTFEGLRVLARRAASVLNAIGIGRGDKSPSSAEWPRGSSSCFVAVAGCATAAPLNPAYKADEFAFNLADLNIRGVIVMDTVWIVR